MSELIDFVEDLPHLVLHVPSQLALYLTSCDRAHLAMN